MQISFITLGLTSLSAGVSPATLTPSPLATVPYSMLDRVTQQAYKTIAAGQQLALDPLVARNLDVGGSSLFNTDPHTMKESATTPTSTPSPPTTEENRSWALHNFVSPTGTLAQAVAAGNATGQLSLGSTRNGSTPNPGEPPPAHSGRSGRPSTIQRNPYQEKTEYSATVRPDTRPPQAHQAVTRSSGVAYVDHSLAAHNHYLQAQAETHAQQSHSGPPTPQQQPPNAHSNVTSSHPAHTHYEMEPSPTATPITRATNPQYQTVIDSPVFSGTLPGVPSQQTGYSQPTGTRAQTSKATTVPPLSQVPPSGQTYTSYSATSNPSTYTTSSIEYDPISPPAMSLPEFAGMNSEHAKLALSDGARLAATQPVGDAGTQLVLHQPNAAPSHSHPSLLSQHQQHTRLMKLQPNMSPQEVASMQIDTGHPHSSPLQDERPHIATQLPESTLSQSVSTPHPAIPQTPIQAIADSTTKPKKGRGGRGSRKRKQPPPPPQTEEITVVPVGSSAQAGDGTHLNQLPVGQQVMTPYSLEMYQQQQQQHGGPFPGHMDLIQLVAAQHHMAEGNPQPGIANNREHSAEEPLYMTNSYGSSFVSPKVDPEENPLLDPDHNNLLPSEALSPDSRARCGLAAPQTNPILPPVPDQDDEFAHLSEPVSADANPSKPSKGSGNPHGNPHGSSSNPGNPHPGSNPHQSQSSMAGSNPNPGTPQSQATSPAAAKPQPSGGFQDSFLSFLRGKKPETLSSVTNSAVMSKPQLPKYIPDNRPRIKDNSVSNFRPLDRQLPSSATSPRAKLSTDRDSISFSDDEDSQGGDSGQIFSKTVDSVISNLAEDSPKRSSGGSGSNTKAAQKSQYLFGAGKAKQVPKRPFKALSTKARPDFESEGPDFIMDVDEADDESVFSNEELRTIAPSSKRALAEYLPPREKSTRKAKEKTEKKRIERKAKSMIV